MLNMGMISLDGSKMKANASNHKALSYKHACEFEKQLKLEVEALLKMAEKQDDTPIPNDLSIPEALKRREDCLLVIAEIERRADERHQHKQLEYEEKVARRDAIKEAGATPKVESPRRQNPWS
jgi:hypothetical protein